MTKKENLLRCFLTFMVFSALAVYLFQTEKLTKENYLAEKFEREIKILSEENGALKEEYFEKFSIKGAEEKTEKLGFVKISQIKYIPVAFDYLARQTTR